jgi:hypothetical protein
MECCVLTRRDLVPCRQLAIDAASIEGLDLLDWPAEFLPVLSLTIIHEVDGCEKILVAIRDPATNRYHPDVVSVPTQRISREMAELLYAPLRPDAADERVKDGAFASETLDRFVLSIFTNKLGMEDGIFGLGDFDAKLRRVDFGESLIGAVHGEPVTEKLGMLGVEVLVNESFAERIGDVFDEPMAATSSYSHLMWLPLDQFQILAVSRDAAALPIGLKAAEVCVHGLCMHSAVEIVRGTRADVLRTTAAARCATGGPVPGRE